MQGGMGQGVPSAKALSAVLHHDCVDTCVVCRQVTVIHLYYSDRQCALYRL